MKVSVIIPNFNRRTLLGYAIQSVLTQTYEDLELLICDDGSTDGSLEVARLFNDSRIRCLRGSNSGGPAGPRNRGIASAQGEWLSFLDSDDQWESTKLQKQIDVIKEAPVLAVCTNAKVLVGGEILTNPYFPFDKDRIYSFDHLLKTNPVICSSMMIHKSIIREVGGFPEATQYRAIEDYALWAKCTMITDIYFIAEPLTIYRADSNDSIRLRVSSNEEIQKIKILKYAWSEATKSRSSKAMLQLKIFLRLIRIFPKLIFKLSKYPTATYRQRF